MYEAFFSLAKRPFVPVPCPDQYYPCATIEAARQTLARCIARAEGPAMVIGPSGTGKTLLCQVLAEQFRAQLQVVVLTGAGLGTRRALLQAILYGLGQPYRGMDEGELRLALVDHLCGGKKKRRVASSDREECLPSSDREECLSSSDREECLSSSDREECLSSAGMLLLADEAHAMPLRLLDELRTIANIVQDGQSRAQIVLAGGPVLEERLASPKLESLAQRVVARCYLEALNRSETEAYIHSQIEKAGGRAADIFSAESCSCVHQATDGVPRLVNHLCDHVLLMAYAAGRPAILPEHVEEAWRDLQQLPTPWNGEGSGVGGQGSGARAQGSGIRGQGAVEFGELTDEPEAGIDSDAHSPADSAYPEPAEQLQRIETLIAGLGSAPRDFEPAASGGPEVEVVIEDFGDPFGERFQEEELVVDRFAAAMARLESRVESRESREEGRESRVESRGGRESRGEEGGWEGEDSPVGVAGEMPGEVHAATAVLGRAESEWASARVDAGTEVAAMEEGCPNVEPPQGPCAAPARPQKYRQLFCRLRGGAP
jgi:type II secretory pathway predicted ATPase ExeA